MRLLRLLTTLCAALVTGLSFSHVLELPQKMAYDSHQYVDSQHSLYAYFAIIGGPLEVLTIVLAIVVAVRSRGTAAFGLSLASAILFAIGLAEWGAVVQTANTVQAQWDPSAMPSDWTTTREQWEFGHVGHFVIFFVGFVMQLVVWSRTAPRSTT
ncbi:MAG: hypothetical protein WCA46_02450 [Actinocatenispora sp.]